MTQSEVAEAAKLLHESIERRGENHLHYHPARECPTCIRASLSHAALDRLLIHEAAQRQEIERLAAELKETTK